ncbi:hypothetical protein ACFE33_12315 [Falsihalocynthiibacter sp. SS001]|uniref:hypothetical protein n=1 Tax=Falsihalocynthiibacter sp. SS001 TaxID=3349698 RepID=UPI0036D2B550
MNELGQEGAVKAFAFADAGMAAFHSRLIALDHIGLGSSLVTHNGVTPEIISQYNPDIIVLHGNPEQGIRSDYDQQVLLDWALKNGLGKLCIMQWRPTYILHIFSRVSHSNIEELCEKTVQVNNVSNENFTLNSMQVPPWRWWTE